jgi:CRP/FNR family transcriptional regulator, polysaccharide utilization system transcription regulator
MKNYDQCFDDLNCTDCPLQSPLCKLLTQKELEILNLNRYKIFFKAGETIRKQGTHMSHVISIQSGHCKLYLEGFNQKNIILRIIKANNFIGGPGMYIDQKHHYTVSAIVDTSACFIEIKNFKKIMGMNKAFNDAVVAEICNNSLLTYNRLINITQKQMNGRIADVLIYLANHIYNSMEFELSLSKQDIAELAGATRDSSVKVLRSLVVDGYISHQGNQIKILDYDGLERISQIG